MSLSQPEPESTDQALSTVTPIAPHLSVVESSTDLTPRVTSEVAEIVEPAPSWVQAKLVPWAKSVITTPDIVKQDQPSLRTLRAYGAYGSQVPDEGILHKISVAWSYFAMYHAARAYTRVWLMQNPTRAAIFIALLITAALIPQGRHLMTYLLWPAHTAIDLLTDF